MDMSREYEVKAAGGVVWRTRKGKVDVLLVHRPRYDDWSFPKGKLDAGESFRAGAVREVREETGLDVHLGPELASAVYRDALGRSKIVRYWAMTVVDGEFEKNREVDAVAWVRLGEAAERLTYAHDVDVLDSFAAVCTDR
jgi:8-oxo-(d)GTP phosphatase